MQLMGRIPNFDEPIDALEICHENIVKRMETMARLAAILRREGPAALTGQADIWRELFSFIKHNIAKHSLDEEEGLFPLLREAMGSQIDELEKDHDWAEETERFLIAEFDAIIPNAASITPERLEIFARRAEELAGFYKRHIERENGIIFPAARAHLNEEQLAALGTLMRRHRRLEIALPEEHG